MNSAVFRDYTVLRDCTVTSSTALRGNYSRKNSSEFLYPSSRFSSNQSKEIWTESFDDIYNLLVRPDRGSYSRLISPLQQRKKSSSYVIANESLDYKALFEREKLERKVVNLLLVFSWIQFVELKTSRLPFWMPWTESNFQFHVPLKNTRMEKSLLLMSII